MKCNCKTISNLSPSEREKLKQALNKYETKYLEQETDKLKLLITNNLLKVVTVACNTSCGIGQKRLVRILDCIYNLLIESKGDEAFFEHLDMICQNVLGKENCEKYFLKV